MSAAGEKAREDLHAKQSPTVGDREKPRPAVKSYQENAFWKHPKRGLKRCDRPGQYHTMGEKKTSESQQFLFSLFSFLVQCHASEF